MPGNSISQGRYNPCLDNQFLWILRQLGKHEKTGRCRRNGKSVQCQWWPKENPSTPESCQLGGFNLISVSTSHSLLEYLSTFIRNSHSVFALSASPPGRASVSWRSCFSRMFVLLLVCVLSNICYNRVDWERWLVPEVENSRLGRRLHFSVAAAPGWGLVRLELLEI